MSLDVIKIVFENQAEYLEELIEPAEIDYKDLLNNYNLNEKFEQYLLDEEVNIDEDIEDNEELINYMTVFIEQEYSEYLDYGQDSNYPMWNTCFEFKSNWSSARNVAIKMGCGIINESSLFNDMIFMSSCGHSFYSSYWIPMYLEIFHNEAKKYMDIDYSDL